VAFTVIGELAPKELACPVKLPFSDRPLVLYRAQTGTWAISSLEPFLSYLFCASLVVMPVLDNSKRPGRLPVILLSRAEDLLLFTPPFRASKLLADTSRAA
jgi:hypothetical protein